MTAKTNTSGSLPADTAATTPDLSPRALVKAGRGNLGGTTALAILSEIALHDGRKVMMADGDVRNPGISQFKAIYGKRGFPRPDSEDVAHLKEWYTNAFAAALQNEASLVMDVGGGDRTLEEWASEDSLVDAADAMGLPVTGLFMCGPQAGDIDYLLKLWETGLFLPHRGVIILNDWSIPVGHKPDTLFTPLCMDQRLTTVSGMETAILRIPKLSCMKDVLASGLTFHDAADGKPGASGRPLDPMRRWQGGHWISKIRENIANEGIEAWLP